LRTAGGRLDTRRGVVWLQGRSLFVDLRLPAGPDAPQAVAGFAGVLTRTGSAFEWRHDIDLAPSADPDAGTLDWDGEVLVERGLHDAYLERWRRAPARTEPCWGLRLTIDGGRRRAVLLRVGDDVGWATGPDAPEVCLAHADGDGAFVTHSSRPDSVGARLRWSVGTTAVTTRITAPGCGTSESRWRVVYREGPAG
jgi:hypothetical protein